MSAGDDNANIEINVEQFELQLQNNSDGVDIISDLANDERIIDEQFHEDESCVEDTATPAAVNRKKTYTIAGLALVCVLAIAIGAAAGINKKNGDAATMSASAALEAYCQDLVTASYEKQEEESKPTPSPTNPPLFYSNDVAADIFINDDNEQLRRELRGRRGGKNRRMEDECLKAGFEIYSGGAKSSKAKSNKTPGGSKSGKGERRNLPDLSLTPVDGTLSTDELVEFNQVCADVTGSGCDFTGQIYFQDIETLVLSTATNRRRLQDSPTGAPTNDPLLPGPPTRDCNVTELEMIKQKLDANITVDVINCVADLNGDGEVNITDLELDLDNDGIPAYMDVCPEGTDVPEEFVPTIELKPNRFALNNTTDPFTFAKGEPTGQGQGSNKGPYTLTDTWGCNCEQIIDLTGLGEGHVKFGCSGGNMQCFVENKTLCADTDDDLIPSGSPTENPLV